MDKDYVIERFQMTKEQAPGYKQIRKNSKVIGVWDDHDFGINDGDKDFEFKDQNRELFLNFIDEPVDSERRMQTGTPIHQDYFITKNGKTVHVILLDGRYELDTSTGDRLGQDQWKWLDLTLKRGKERNTELTVIGTGVQIIHNSYVRTYAENFWAESRAQFYQTLADNEVANVILITGDVHMA